MAGDQVNGSDSGSESGAPVYRIHPNEDIKSPYYIQPADVSVRLGGDAFNGKNYISGSKTFEMSLFVKKKLGFIDGSLPQPDRVKDPVLFEAWESASSLVFSWLVMSVAPELRQNLLYFTNAREIWSEMRTRYE